MTATIELVDLSTYENTFDDICCESLLHARENRPTHAADYWAIASCGRTIPVCNQRRRLCRQHGNWLCAGEDACTARHAYDEITWEPVT